MFLRDEGTIVLLTPSTKEEEKWLRRNVSYESWQWLGGSLACEPRYVDVLLDAMSNDGVTSTIVVTNRR